VFPDRCFVLPLRDLVVFPFMVVPLFVGREKSVKALEESLSTDDKHILLVTQKDPADDDPEHDAIHTMGTLSKVLQMLKLPDGTVKVLVEGIVRAEIASFSDREDVLEAFVRPVTEIVSSSLEVKALVRSVSEEFENYIRLSKQAISEVWTVLSQDEDYSKFADFIATHLTAKIQDKQELLEALDVMSRMEKELSLISYELSILQCEKRVRSRVKKQMERTQRDYYLNEQIKAMQKELSDGAGDGRNELSDLEDKLSEVKLSKEAKEKANSELKKLRQMSPMSAEATVVRNYLDWVLGLPWGKKSRLKHDLVAAQRLLDAEHYGLDKVKERIIEYLAVQVRTNTFRGPILCLVGPPGVGKTSLAKSIAKASGREFARISLGGIRDEAEIRGHRRTYIGSMPGKILQALRKAKKNNALVLLDEIDKMGVDFRGDPASALLEVLDREQNNAFMDHYLEVEYDLSNVMFVATANTLNISAPLLDRMEVMRIAGYTDEEKINIASRHLIPDILKEHKLTKKELSIDTASLREIIRHRTREAGVRNLKREITVIVRKATKAIVMKNRKQVRVNPKVVNDYLGVPRYRHTEVEQEERVGVVTGLAWTEVGGEVLNIEAAPMPGKGKMMVTGNLKDVMKESISAASSYVRSQAVKFGIEPTLFDRRDVHVHVPEGATPKDGPSAGIAMAVAIISAMTGIQVSKKVAMTGEITLRGRVLAVGGIKEKLLSAVRGEVEVVLIPEANTRDLEEIPADIRSKISIVSVSWMSEVLQYALVRQPVPIQWKEEADITVTALKNEQADFDDDQSVLTAH